MRVWYANVYNGEIYLTFKRVIVILKDVITILKIKRILLHLTTFLQSCVVNISGRVSTLNLAKSTCRSNGYSVAAHKRVASLESSTSHLITWNNCCILETYHAILTKEYVLGSPKIISAHK